jgi:hypothetical protein
LIITIKSTHATDIHNELDNNHSFQNDRNVLYNVRDCARGYDLDYAVVNVVVAVVAVVVAFVESVEVAEVKFGILVLDIMVLH